MFKFKWELVVYGTHCHFKLLKVFGYLVCYNVSESDCTLYGIYSYYKHLTTYKPLLFSYEKETARFYTLPSQVHSNKNYSYVYKI